MVHGYSSPSQIWREELSMTKVFQLVIFAAALITALAAPTVSLWADGGGPWPVPPIVNVMNS